MTEELRIPSNFPEDFLLGRWLVPDGGRVEIGQGVCELEGEKATVDLPSPLTGTLSHMVPEGTRLRAGLIIGWVRHQNA